MPALDWLALAGTSASGSGAITDAAATAAASGKKQRQRRGRQDHLDGCHGALLHFAPGIGVDRYGKPGSSGTTAWSTASCSSSDVAPSGTARRVAGRAEAQRVGVAVGHAQAAHHRHQRRCRPRRPSAGGRSGSRRGRPPSELPTIPAGSACAKGSGRDRRVQPQHLRGHHVGRLVDAGDAGQEGGHQVGARQVGRRGVAESASTISSSAGSVGLVT